MSEFEIWAEGYQATCEKNGATFKGKFQADSFKQACIKWSETLPRDIIHFFNKDKLTWWGCRLFDNENDARKSFG